MTDRDTIIEAIQAFADATGDPALRIAFGSPGAWVENAIGEQQETGQAWEDPPTTWTVVLDGIAGYLDSQRSIGASGPLLVSDRILLVTSPAVTVSLPAASAAYRTRYVIKALNVAGTQVSGTVDGVAGPHAIAAYGVLRVYCTGTEWVTW